MANHLSPEQCKLVREKHEEVGKHFAETSIEMCTVMLVSPYYYLDHTVDECVAEINRRVTAGEITPDMFDLPSEGYVRPYIDPEEDEIIQGAMQFALAQNIVLMLRAEGESVSNELNDIV